MKGLACAVRACQLISPGVLSHARIHMTWFLQVATQIKESGAKELSLNAKRQILADILVWAEVTQDHYDQNTLQ